MTMTAVNAQRTAFYSNGIRETTPEGVLRTSVYTTWACKHAHTHTESATPTGLVCVSLMTDKDKDPMMC